MAAPTLFDNVPDGFLYQPEFVTKEEEAALLDRIGAMEFSTVVMRGVAARRRVLQFGWRYSFDRWTLDQGADLPRFLVPLRDRAAALAGVAPAELSEALLTEYPAGATIGWHRDAPMFGLIVGVSLLAACTFRLRRGMGRGHTPLRVDLAPRSAYVLDGAARRDWQHSISPTRSLRYSVTFRTLRRR